MNHAQLLLLLLLLSFSQDGRRVGYTIAMRGSWLLNGAPISGDTVSTFTSSSTVQRNPARTASRRDFIELRVMGKTRRIDCAIAAACDTITTIRPPISGNLGDLDAVASLERGLRNSRVGRFLVMLGDLGADTRLRDGIVVLDGRAANLGTLISPPEDGVIVTACSVREESESCDPEVATVARCSSVGGNCRIGAVRPGAYSLHLFRAVQRSGRMVFVSDGRPPAVGLFAPSELAQRIRARLDTLDRELRAWDPLPSEAEQRLHVRSVLLLAGEAGAS